MFCGTHRVQLVILCGSAWISSQAYTTLIRLTYGLNVVSDDDELISIFAETVFRLIKEGTPGVSIIDLFPIRESFSANY